MNNNESLDSMARRYKDEMMRLYHSGTGGGTQNNSSPPRCGPDQPDGQCRFMSAEEIIGSQSNAAPAAMNSPQAYGEAVSVSAPASDNLAVNGSVNMDSNSRNSSGENIYVPYNSSAPSDGTLAYAASDTDEGSPFLGIRINTARKGHGNHGNAPSEQSSEVFSELLPAFDFPPDLDEEAASPRFISPAFGIIGSWTNLTGDNGWGLLQFEVTTGSLGNPVQNARVVVSRIVNHQRLLTRILTTGYSGLTKSIYLPAPRYTCGLGWSCTSRPFAEYTASVYANGYYPVTNISIIIEAGVKCIQPVDMVPLPSMGTRPGIMPRNGE